MSQALQQEILQLLLTSNRFFKMPKKTLKDLSKAEKHYNKAQHAFTISQVYTEARDIKRELIAQSRHSDGSLGPLYLGCLSRPQAFTDSLLDHNLLVSKFLSTCNPSFSLKLQGSGGFGCSSTSPDLLSPSGLAIQITWSYLHSSFAYRCRTASVARVAGRV